MEIETIQLLRFEPEHTDELVSMWRSSFQHGVGIVDHHPIEDQRDYFVTEVVPKNAVLVAFIKNEIVGFVAASNESIAQLYVHVDHHRRGIGSRLLEWAKNRSAGSLWLHTFECNEIAQRFYEDRGFKVVERGFEETWQLPDIKYSWSRL